MAAPRIFISHSSTDDDFGHRLVQDLRAILGEDGVWYDSVGGLDPGVQYWSNIVAELTARDTFIVLLSPDALQSKWVQDEINMAWNQKNSTGKNIIPLVIRQCEPRADLKTLQMVFFVGSLDDGNWNEEVYQRGLNELRAALQILPGQTPSGSPAQYRSPDSLQRERDTHVAFVRRDWNNVIERTNYIRMVEGGTLPSPLLWRERGFAYVELGEQAAREGKKQEAEEAGRTALEAFDQAWRHSETDRTGAPATFRGKARALLLLGRYAEALQALATASGAVPDEDVTEKSLIMEVRCAVLQQMGQLDDALVWAERALSMDLSNEERRKWLAIKRDLLVAAGNRQEALQVARQVTSMRESLPEDWLARADIAKALDDTSDIRDTIQEGQRRWPTDPRFDESRLLPPIPTERFPLTLHKLNFEARKINGVEVITPPVCEVPAGDRFRMGDGRSGNNPVHAVLLPAYAIGKYPVTVAEYNCAVRVSAVPEPHWMPPDQDVPTWQKQLEHLDHPVVNVPWKDAMAYAAWLRQVTGEKWHLPTEAEWEKAARGTDGRLYPWGDEPDPTRANTSESHHRGVGGTTTVGSYPTGASPYGVQDMIGNVWEWCSSLLLPYDNYEANEHQREDPNAPGPRVLRGGSWASGLFYARAAYRLGSAGGLQPGGGGFRLALG